MPTRNFYIDGSTEKTAVDIPSLYSHTNEDAEWYVDNVYLPYRDSGMEAASQDPEHPLSGIPDAFARGFYRLGQGANALQVQLGLDNPENAAREIGEYQKYIEQVPYDKEVLDSLNNIVEAESIGEIWDEVTTMPGLRAVGNVVAESLAQYSPAFAAMLASLAFPPSAIAIGSIAGLGSLSVEVQGTLLEEMQKYLNETGEDISDDVAVTKLLGDEERMAEFSEHAAKRGIPIGLIDGLSVGFAGKIAATLSKSRRTANKALEAARKTEAKVKGKNIDEIPAITPKSKIPERLAFTAEALALQPLAGGVGEAVAQQVAGEEFQLGPVALEFIAEIPGGTAETGIGLALANRRENKILELEETERKVAAKELQLRKKQKADEQLATVTEDVRGGVNESGVPVIESYEDALFESSTIKNKDGTLKKDIKEGEVAFDRSKIRNLFNLKSGKAIDQVIEYFVNKGTVRKRKGSNQYEWTNQARKHRGRLQAAQTRRSTKTQRAATGFTERITEAGTTEEIPTPISIVGATPPSFPEISPVAREVGRPIKDTETTIDGEPVDISTLPPGRTIGLEDKIPEPTDTLPVLTETTPTAVEETATIEEVKVDPEVAIKAKEDFYNKRQELIYRVGERWNTKQQEPSIEREEAIDDLTAMIEDVETELTPLQERFAQTNEEIEFTEIVTGEPQTEIEEEVAIEEVVEEVAPSPVRSAINEMLQAVPKQHRVDTKGKPFKLRERPIRPESETQQAIDLIKDVHGAIKTGTYLDLNVTEQERLNSMFKDEEDFVDGIIIDISAATTPAERNRIANLIKKRWEKEGTGKTGKLTKTLGALHSAFYKVYHPLRIADLNPIYRPFSRSILKRRQKRQLYDSTGFKFVEGFMKNTPPEQVAKISTVSLVLDALFSNRKGSVLTDKNVTETKDGGLTVKIPEKLPKDSNITIDNFNVILNSLNKGKEVEVKPGAVITLTKEENDKFKQTQKSFRTMFDIVSRAYARFNLQRYKLYDGVEQSFDDTHESLREKTIESAARYIEDINKILPEGKKIKVITGKGKQKRNLKQKLAAIYKDSPLYKELRAASKNLPKDIGKFDTEKYRRALGQASTLIMMNEQRNILADHPYYVPRLRYGNHYFTVTENKKDGKVVGYYASTPAAFDVGEKAQLKRLQELRKEIITDFPSDKYKVTEIKTRDVETTKRLLDQPTLNTVQRLAEMIGYEKQFKEKKGEIYEFFQDLEDTINATGFGRYMAQRGNEVIVGYATPKNIDTFLPIALSNYIRSAADTASNLEYTRPLQHSIKRMDNEGYQKLAALAQHQLDDINKEGEPGALFKTIAFHYALGANFSSAMVNLSQPFVTTIPLLTAMTGNPALATKEVLRGLKDAVKLMKIKNRLDTYGFDFQLKEPPYKGITQDEWNYLRYLSRKGDIQANVNLDLGARYQQGLGEVLEGQRLVGTTARSMEKVMDVSAFMFGGVEQINRISTALATYRLATKSNKNLRNFQKFSEVTMFHEGKMTPELAGEMMVYNTQFLIGKENRPELFRSGLMNVATQFMSFPLQYFGLWAKAMRVAGVDKKMGSTMMGSMLLAMVAFGGMMGLPFAENLRQLLAAASRATRGYDYDLEYGVREAMLGYLHPEMVEVIMRGGLSRATGMDVSRRMGAGEVLPFTLMQGDLMAATGPFGGLMADTAMRIHEAIKLGNYPMLITSPLPLSLRYAAESAVGGYLDMPIRTTQGRVMLPADQVTLGDRLKQAVGFTPEDVSTARREKRLLNFWKGQSKNLQDYYLSNLAKLHADLYRATDSASINEINNEIDVLLNEVSQLNEEALADQSPQKVVNLGVRALRERVAVELQGQIPRLQKKLRKFGPLIEERLKEMVPR